MSNQRRFALIGRGFGSDAFEEAVEDVIGAILVDSSEINFTYTDATPSITAALINASITFARLQNFDALSVLGRSANSAGVSDEIAAGANDRLLRRTSDALNFGQLTAGMFPNTVVPDAALSSNVPLLNAANVFTNTLDALTFEAGGAAGGGYGWDNDNNTYIWLPSLDTVRIQTAGGNTAQFSATAIDFTATAVTVNGLDLASGAAVSLLGRSANSAGARADIAAGANDRILRRTSDALNFGQLTAGMFPNTVVPDAALSSNVALLDRDVPQTFTGRNVFAASYNAGYGLRIEASGDPGLEITRTSAAADTQKWAIEAGPTSLIFYVVNDARSVFTAWQVVSRTTTTVDSIALTATEVDLTATTLDFNGDVVLDNPIRLQGYTVATLPAGTQGDTAYVTDALAPAFLTALVGGGAVVTPAFYDGTNWVAI